MAESLVQVTAGVIVQTGQVLVCQRPAGGHHPFKWEFPGGKVEPGESLEAGMRRELQEELGIDAVVGSPLWQSQHQYPGRSPFALTFFSIQQYAGAVTNREFAALRWVAVGDLGDVDFLDGDREFVAALRAGQVQLRETAVTVS
jgi:8-oxo-dGTP diphosphatase